MTLLTIKEAAQKTRMSALYIRTAIKKGELVHARLGRMIRIREEDLDAFVARNIVGTPTVSDVIRDNFTVNPAYVKSRSYIP